VNKYIIIAIVGAVLLGGGVLYRVFLLPQSAVPVTTGKVRTVKVTAIKDQWRFDPELVEVDRGDKVVMTVVNEDGYDHGIAIDAFGISQRMPANSTITLEFVATQEGDFPFYCSVPCGEGTVDSKKRGHFDMVGKLHIRSIVSSTQ